MNECSTAATSPCPGGRPGRPFWNPEAFQFMYVPAFQFQPIPGASSYIYELTDEKGVIRSFTAKDCSANLEPVWRDIPEGVVKLTVTAADKDGNKTWQAGSRTFFKLASFPDDLPGPARGYREAALKTFEYALSKPFMQHWITEGTPHPDYNHYVYPSKMSYGIIIGMLSYAGLCPERADDAMKIAVACADYLIGITPKSGPMKGIPPTYQINFRPNPETRQNLKAAERINQCMMIYPPHVGIAYLELYKATGDKKYYDAAMEIACYFRDTVEENGSWMLIRDYTTGEAIAPDYCEALREFYPFFSELCSMTGDAVWKKLCDGCVAYAESAVESYNFGGQFEDSKCSVSYSNLSHYGATTLIRYYCENYADNEEKMAVADELMRFVEDQFVIWKRPSPWNKSRFDTSLWHTPCGLEQYGWHVPIDASTSDIYYTFMEMYKAGRGELHLAKAMALADSVTRAQQENGLIPTHWMDESYRKGKGMWINCMFYAADRLLKLADFLDSLK